MKPTPPVDLRDDLPDAARKAIVKLRRQQNDDSRIVVAPREAGVMLSRGRTTIAKLINHGDLLVVLDGQDQRVLTESIYDLLVARVRASYASDGQLRRSHGFRGTQFQHMPKAAPSPELEPPSQPVDAA
jgi:hypothetical protein